ncbi:MAG: tetratricopeptide repeat protein [Phycisphaeraceae bacterium]|nr:tetratricopeptide repeat protein [Phycisphaeraceae bacterium]
MAETIKQRAQRVLIELADLPPEAQAAALHTACAGNDTLRAEVQALLDAEARSGGLLGSPTAIREDDVTIAAETRASHGVPIPALLREAPGSCIGPYKLLQLIGEGGFGSVFMAEQEQPVQRKVALKIIKLGMDTRQVVARFEQERQALAILDHPNIAKVFDAGATETGRPFFVMELVKGEPLSEYADRHNLSIEDRLELFAQVCQAVQHAHTKGIIHRDLKPGNVLVSSQDGKPIAKVIDFGIAKATAARLTEKTVFTEHRQIIGTPEYMSPEQAEGSLDIDTRTDVYALGVMLYELLTGTTPFGGSELRSAAYAEMQRIIREVEPPKPSTRLSQNAATLASVAARRKTEPNRLGSIVRGELDWIVMKALEKDRQRRYETANGLAMDIKRYLSGEAVVAAPPSNAYRFKKFVKRNKGPVAAGLVVSAVLVLGLIGTSVGLVRAERARASEAAQRVLADAARAEAEVQEAEAKKQAEIAEAVAKFQTDMLAAVDPNQLPKDPVTGEPIKDAVTVLQALQAAVKVLDEGGNALKDQPLVEARVRDTIGTTLRELGRYDEAEPNLRRSLEIRRASLPAGHAEIAQSLNNLALLLYVQDNNAGVQNWHAEAESLFRQSLEIYRAALPAGHPDIAFVMNNLALLLSSQNKLAEAEPLFRESLEMRRAAHPAGHPDIAISLNNLALLLDAQNKLAEAEPLYREALAILRAALPVGHPDIASNLGNLGSLLHAQNKFAEAEPLYREALAIRRASLPAGHPDIAYSLHRLANLLYAQNKLAEAEPLLREALAILRAALPVGHTSIASTLNKFAQLLQAQNEFAEAELFFRESLAIIRAALPDGHPHIATVLNNLASLLLDQNKLAEAEPLFREALAIYRATNPAGHPNIATGLSNFARAQQALGQTAEARAGFDEAIAMLHQGSPDGSPLLARILWRSGTARLENKDYAAALAELEEAVAMGEKVLPADHAHLKEYRETLTQCKAAMAEQGQPDAK